MGPREKKDLIYLHASLAANTQLLGYYNGAATVVRSQWLAERGHPEKVETTILFDLLRLRLGVLKPSQFSVVEYIEAYSSQLKTWLNTFDVEVPAGIAWWVLPYSFDVQCETGDILVNDYSGDFNEWCIKQLHRRLA